MGVRTFGAAVVAVLVNCAIAAAQNNTIRGKVRTDQGSTVNNAMVVLSVNSGGTIGQVVTGNDGDFTFGQLESGEYTITVTASGYEPAIEKVHFDQTANEKTHDTMNVEVFIKPTPEEILAPPGTAFAQDVPKAARTAYEKGKAKLGEGKSDEGIALLRQATDTFDTYFDAYFALGAALYKTGQFDDAIAALEKAREINEQDGAVYHVFGLIMIKQGKFTVAEYAFRNAAKLNVTSPASHFYHAYVLIELAGRSKLQRDHDTELAESDAELAKAWELSNKRLFPVYLEQARILQMRGDNQGAAAKLEAFLKAVPDYKQAAAVRETIARLREDKKKS
jgi:tetratricopeptide (TPR) repeat protein